MKYGERDLRDQAARSVEANDMRGAIATMTSCVELAPTVENLLYLACLLDKADDDESALEAIDRALMVDPSSHEAVLQKIEFLPLNRSDEAESLCRHVLSKCPLNGRAFANLGRLLLRHESRASAEEARSSLETAIRLDEADKWSWAYYAYSLWRLDRVVEAEAAYRHACKLEHNDIDMVYFVSMFLLDCRRVADADAAWSSLSRRIEIADDEMYKRYLEKRESRMLPEGGS
ncbi:MAG: hypothetical protein K2Q20_10560 [Phycisphaerales bacterium]|nr:hypothetical protein [Phycisphaerales bacterium]